MVEVSEMYKQGKHKLLKRHDFDSDVFTVVTFMVYGGPKEIMGLPACRYNNLGSKYACTAYLCWGLTSKSMRPIPEGTVCEYVIKNGAILDIFDLRICAINDNAFVWEKDGQWQSSKDIEWLVIDPFGGAFIKLEPIAGGCKAGLFADLDTPSVRYDGKIKMANAEATTLKHQWLEFLFDYFIREWPAFRDYLKAAQPAELPETPQSAECDVYKGERVEVGDVRQIIINGNQGIIQVAGGNITTGGDVVGRDKNTN